LEESGLLFIFAAESFLYSLHPVEEAFLSPLPYYAYHQQDNHQNSCTDDDWNKNGQ